MRIILCRLDGQIDPVVTFNCDGCGRRLLVKAETLRPGRPLVCPICDQHRELTEVDEEEITRQLEKLVLELENPKEMAQA